ncbi:MAG TPA: ABC transporter permease [Bryobacteraceae bacterium]
MRSVRRGIRKLILRRRLHEELEAELAHHRELSKQNENSIGLGNPAIVTERILDERRFNLLENAWRDGLVALRRLRKNPAYALTATGSIALGIGVCTAMFTILNAVSLRPLPYANSDKLVWITQVLKANSTDEVTFTPDFLDWRSSNRTFESLAAYNEYTRSLTGVAEPMQVHTVKASAALLPTLRVQPFLGRNLSASADTAGHEKVALLSYRIWRRRFASDRSIVGKPVLLDGEQYMVTGVLPESFQFPGPQPIDIITGLGKNEAGELARDGKVFTIVRNIIGRLKPGVTNERARQDLMAIQAHLPLPPWSPTITIKLIPLRDHLFGNAKIVTLVLVSGSLLFLLIASTNVGSLSLVQLMQRDREVAIRRVLGATRRRVLWQISIEGWALVCLAIPPALLVTVGIRGLLVAFGPYRTGIYGHLPIDLRVTAFAAILLVATILILGTLPALRISDFHLGAVIAGGQTSIAGKRQNLRLLSLVGALEIAVVVALSSSAALMLKSFWNMRYKDLGFESQHAIAATINLGGSRYDDRTQEFTFVRQLLEMTAAIPGVEMVAPTIAGEIPPGGGPASNTVRIEGRPLPVNSRHKALAKPQETNGDYFKILKIPLLEGRLLRESDRAQTAPVVVVNEQFARRYFPGENALGHRLQTGGMENAWYTLVGVVGDVKTSGLAAFPEPTVYTPYEQSGGGGIRDLGILIRSALPVSAIASAFRKIVHDLDPEQPITSIDTLDERLNASVSRPRFAADVLSTFSCFGVLLAIIGVYGVLACRTRAQIREIAVRQALGAKRGDIMANVLGHAVRLVLPGLLGGIGLAMLGDQLLASLLFEVKPTDLSLFVASFLPAFRASRLDPLVSLRED